MNHTNSPTKHHTSNRNHHTKNTNHHTKPIGENDFMLKRVCRDFMNKKCTREGCHFIHDTKLCKHFWKNFNVRGQGSCKYDKNCRKNHFVTCDNQVLQPKRPDRDKKPPNTESWDPITRPYDIRLLFEPKDHLSHSLKANEVLVATNVFGENDIYNKLVKELSECDIPAEDLLKLWHGSRERNISGTHLICNDRTSWKQKCPTFNLVIDRLVEFFKVTPKATRLNWYTDHTQFKPLHRDAAALDPEKAKKQNITIAVSFGQTRDIVFQSLTSKHVIGFPQGDGDVYTFGNDVNLHWRHGVQPGNSDADHSGRTNTGRISVIVWGSTIA